MEEVTQDEKDVFVFVDSREALYSLNSRNLIFMSIAEEWGTPDEPSVNRFLDDEPNVNRFPDNEPNGNWFPDDEPNGIKYPDDEPNVNKFSDDFPNRNSFPDDKPIVNRLPDDELHIIWPPDDNVRNMNKFLYDDIIRSLSSRFNLIKHLLIGTALNL
ncbi:protein PF3D7_1417600-like [Procambarus clarkii]|uniref:protein PF3D7_1417600-like n=1 Tax=Procambarus clarkii TaxID=6728 RepID=UPI003744602F